MSEDPFKPEIAPEAEELEALIHGLEMAEGFQLFFVRCNVEAQQERLIRSIRERLPTKEIRDFDCSGKHVRHLLDLLNAQNLPVPTNSILQVTGLATSMSDIETVPAFIANLNASRDSFRPLGAPVILWLTEHQLRMIVNLAPDFFSIHSGVYHFAARSEEIEVAVRALGLITLDKLSESDRRKRFFEIAGVLSDMVLIPREAGGWRSEGILRLQAGMLLSSLGQDNEGRKQGQYFFDSASTAHQRVRAGAKVDDRTAHSPAPKPPLTYIVFAWEDAAFESELRRRLQPLVDSKVIILWPRPAIDPKNDLTRLVEIAMCQADLFLVLVSAHLLQNIKETGVFSGAFALDLMLRQTRQTNATVVSILAGRAASDSPLLAEFPILPEGGRPITAWRDSDAAWISVVEGIKKLVLTRQ